MSPMREHTPPEWWDESLYDFMQNVSLDAWVWEFMRRNMLQKLFQKLSRTQGIDAMNPNPDFEEIGYDFIDLYNNYTHPDRRGNNNQRNQFWVIPAVLQKGAGWPENFDGQQFQLSRYFDREYIDLVIDVKRQDEVIMKDFKELLARIRERHREPRKIRLRTKDWYDNKILAVWDLKQQGASYAWIGERLFRSNKTNLTQTAKNAYKVARDKIDKEGWKKLANLL